MEKRFDLSEVFARKMEHDEAVRINEAIKDRGIVPDFRYPNIIRLAPIALYTSYHEIWRVVQVIKKPLNQEPTKDIRKKEVSLRKC